MVSILGLARSPTGFGLYYVMRTAGFNTWAREEPNAKKVIYYTHKARVSILGLARSPTQDAPECTLWF